MPYLFAYLIGAAILAVPSQGGHRMMLLAICGGLASVYIASLILHPAAFWLFAGLIWVIIGSIPILVQHDWPVIPAILLVIAGLLVFPAQFTGQGYAAGNPYLFLSDIAGVLAIIVLGWPAISDLASYCLGRDVRSGNSSFSRINVDSEK